jgi:hypothetical protein
MSKERFSCIKMTMCLTSSMVPVRTAAGVANAFRMLAGSAANAAEVMAPFKSPRLVVSFPIFGYSGL